MSLTKTFLSACTAAALLFSLDAGLSVASASPGTALTGRHPAAVAPQVTEVQYRGRFYARPYAYRGPYYRPYARPYYGYAPYVAGAVGAVIIAEAIRENRARPTDFERCAAQFRSFEPRTGTYTTYDGTVRICPYLE